MEKGRMIYVDESGKKLVTRMFICDMRPVRSGCGMHIVNTFRYGGLRSAEEFLCFAGRFAELYEENEGEKEDELVREVLPGEGRTFAVPRERQPWKTDMGNLPEQPWMRLHSGWSRKAAAM